MSDCLSSVFSIVSIEKNAVTFDIVAKWRAVVHVPLLAGVENGIDLLPQLAAEQDKGIADGIIIGRLQEVLVQNDEDVPIGCGVPVATRMGAVEDGNAIWRYDSNSFVPDAV